MQIDTIDFTDNELKQMHILVATRIIDLNRAVDRFPELQDDINELQVLNNKIDYMRKKRGWKP